MAVILLGPTRSARSCVAAARRAAGFQACLQIWRRPASGRPLVQYHQGFAVTIVLRRRTLDVCHPRLSFQPNRFGPRGDLAVT